MTVLPNYDNCSCSTWEAAAKVVVPNSLLGDLTEYEKRQVLLFGHLRIVGGGDALMRVGVDLLFEEHAFPACFAQYDSPGEARLCKNPPSIRRNRQDQVTEEDDEYEARIRRALDDTGQVFTIMNVDLDVAEGALKPLRG